MTDTRESSSQFLSVPESSEIRKDSLQAADDDRRGRVHSRSFKIPPDAPPQVATIVTQYLERTGAGSIVNEGGRVTQESPLFAMPTCDSMPERDALSCQSPHCAHHRVAVPRTTTTNISSTATSNVTGTFSATSHARAVTIPVKATTATTTTTTVPVVAATTAAGVPVVSASALLATTSATNQYATISPMNQYQKTTSATSATSAMNQYAKATSATSQYATTSAVNQYQKTTSATNLYQQGLSAASQYQQGTSATTHYRAVVEPVLSDRFLLLEEMPPRPSHCSTRYVGYHHRMDRSGNLAARQVSPASAKSRSVKGSVKPAKREASEVSSVSTKSSDAGHPRSNAPTAPTATTARKGGRLLTAPPKKQVCWCC